jgi:hypothetical protein
VSAQRRSVGGREGEVGREVERRRDGADAWKLQAVGAFARVAFIARAAADTAILPHGIAQTRTRGKDFSAHAFFPPPLELCASARAR